MSGRIFISLHASKRRGGQGIACVEIVAYLSAVALKPCVMKSLLLVFIGLLLPASARELAVGDMIPDCELVSANGKPLRISSLHGHAFAITFIFTRCPLPEYCPRLTAHFKEAQQELAKAGGTDWHLLSLSFDPEHDRPAQLAFYAKAHGVDDTRWTFATGKHVREFGARFGLEVTTKDGLINHNLRTVVVDLAGRVQHVFRGSDWTVPDLVWEMQKAMRK